AFLIFKDGTGNAQIRLHHLSQHMTGSSLAFTRKATAFVRAGAGPLSRPNFVFELPPMIRKLLPSFKNFTIGLVVVLFLSAVYLYAFPAPTLVYAGMILLHAGAGVIGIVCLIIFCLRYLRQVPWVARLGWIALSLGGLVGGVLIYVGNTRQNDKWLFLHIGV